MREYKFRGKRIDNGDWVYGHIVKLPLDAGGWDEPPSLEQVWWISNQGVLSKSMEEVDPETVGQFTSLKDKNGKEIYEGDIYHLGDKRILSVIEWHDTGFMGKQMGTKGSYEGLQHWRDRIEIIGNTYESLSEVNP